MSEPIKNEFVWQVRVYYEDTDAGAVVYHSRYLNFFERARTEWLRALGVHQAALAEEHGLVFVVRRMAVDWIRPARLDDVLAVSVEEPRVGASKVEFRQNMTLSGPESGQDEDLIATAEVTAACLTADQFQPVRMPEWIREKFLNE